MDQDTNMNPDSQMAPAASPETPAPEKNSETIAENAAEASRPQKRRGRPPRQKTADKTPADKDVPAAAEPQVPAAAAEPVKSADVPPAQQKIREEPETVPANIQPDRLVVPQEPINAVSFGPPEDDDDDGYVPAPEPISATYVEQPAVPQDPDAAMEPLDTDDFEYQDPSTGSSQQRRNQNNYNNNNQQQRNQNNYNNNNQQRRNQNNNRRNNNNNNQQRRNQNNNYNNQQRGNRYDDDYQDSQRRFFHNNQNNRNQNHGNYQNDYNRGNYGGYQNDYAQEYNSNNNYSQLPRPNAAPQQPQAQYQAPQGDNPEAVPNAAAPAPENAIHPRPPVPTGNIS
jgi:hypothetical protein